MINRIGNPLDTADLGDTLLDLHEIWEAQQRFQFEGLDGSAYAGDNPISAGWAGVRRILDESVVTELAYRQDQSE